jgi:hypothetical protein
VGLGGICPGEHRHGLPPTWNRVADGGRCAKDRRTTEGRGPQKTAAIVRLAGVTRTWLRGGRFPMTSHPDDSGRPEQAYGQLLSSPLSPFSSLGRRPRGSWLVETCHAQTTSRVTPLPTRLDAVAHTPTPRRAVREPGLTAPRRLPPHGKTAEGAVIQVESPQNIFSPLSHFSFLGRRPRPQTTTPSHPPAARSTRGHSLGAVGFCHKNARGHFRSSAVYKVW